MPKQSFEELVLTALKSLQDGQTRLQEDARRLEAGQVELQKDLRRLEVLYEEMAGKIDHIIEVISPEMVKNNEQDTRLDGHDEDLASHNGRLNILESV